MHIEKVKDVDDLALVCSECKGAIELNRFGEERHVSGLRTCKGKAVVVKVARVIERQVFSKAETRRER